MLDYYSRPDIQEEIFIASRHREIGVMYKDRGFGKRPDILQFKSDVGEFAKQGASSFHISLERWKNPLELKSGMSKKELDDLRAGWDFIADIDCKYFEFSKIAAFLLIEALRFHEIENISLKFSGNRSFHVGVAFETFPKVVNNIQIKDIFPQGVRIIADYLKSMIKNELRERILKISPEMGENFDPFSIVDIDSVAISSRHMIRAPYSLNEKSGLVSLPIKIEELKNFELKQARVENVKTKVRFLDKGEPNEASNLLVQAFDWNMKAKRNEPEVIVKKREYEIPSVAIKEEFFPPCIKQILNGIEKDGRKRAVFILINFLGQMGWDYNAIKKILLEWNKKNYEELKEGYILSQLSWHKRQGKKILPPNCDNKSYYFDIGVKCDDPLCKKVKNPVNYAMRKVSFKKNIRKR